MSRHFLLLTIVLFLLTACAEPMSNASKGALIGAAGGALLGQAIGKDTKGTLIGAAAGAAAGGGIGYYMDQQEKAVRDALASVEGVNIVRNGDELYITFRSDNQFKVGSYVLDPNSQQDVARLGQIFAEYDKTAIMVAGHTDSTGGEDLNQGLSEKRAGAVRNILVANGVAKNRVTTLGFGESAPIADNSTNYGRQVNRRVEIKVTPN
jgi:outer membrane protein OmpA-like peptidoglycan-associated protein